MDKLSGLYLEGVNLSSNIGIAHIAWNKPYDVGNEESYVYTLVNKLFTNKIVALSDMLTTFSEAFKKIYTFDNTHNVSLNSVIDSSRVVNIQNNLSYVTVQHLKIPVLEGLKINLLSAMSIIGDNIKEGNICVLPLLKKTKLTVATFNASNESRNRVKPLSDDDIDYDNILTKLINNLNSVINTQDTSDRRELNKLIPNLSTLTALSELSAETSKIISIADLKHIEQETTEIKKKVDILYGILSSSDGIKTSKVMIDRLVEHLERTAEIVSCYISSVHIYRQLNDTYRIIVDELYSKIESSR